MDLSSTFANGCVPSPETDLFLRTGALGCRLLSLVIFTTAPPLLTGWCSPSLYTNIVQTNKKSEYFHKKHFSSADPTVPETPPAIHLSYQYVLTLITSPSLSVRDAFSAARSDPGLGTASGAAAANRALLALLRKNLPLCDDVISAGWQTHSGSDIGEIQSISYRSITMPSRAKNISISPPGGLQYFSARASSWSSVRWISW